MEILILAQLIFDERWPSEPRPKPVPVEQIEPAPAEKIAPAQHDICWPGRRENFLWRDRRWHWRCRY